MNKKEIGKRNRKEKRIIKRKRKKQRPHAAQSQLGELPRCPCAPLACFSFFFIFIF
jgi:hypothetical protein